jgi:glycosyltransferase involved in cell wall biosynthesis
MVLTRAWACATPVVASDITGYREVLSPDAAIDFPPGDERALVDAIEAMLADESRRESMGSAGRKIAQERYSWESIGTRLGDIYDTVAGRAKVDAAAA